MIVAITGSSGLVGSALVHALEADGHLIRPVVRRAPRQGANEIRWDPDQGMIEAAEFANVDGVVHLAGENIAAHRWTESFKQKILTSRVCSTKLLCDTLAGLASKPTILVSASAVGYYGAHGDEPLDESAGPGTDFLAEVCRAWEAEAVAAEPLGLRVVRLRLGVVLAGDGGALTRMLPPFRAFVGGPLGDGRQWMSWIHRDDVTGLVIDALERDTYRGAVNATAPEPATNAEFTRALGRAVSRPTVLRAPARVLRFVLGEMADVLLTGQRVLPRVAERLAYSWRYPELGAALRASVRR
jgi:uncharacterized protein (TIGR01777 family)